MTQSSSSCPMESEWHGTARTLPAGRVSLGPPCTHRELKSPGRSLLGQAKLVQQGEHLVGLQLREQLDAARLQQDAGRRPGRQGEGPGGNLLRARKDCRGGKACSRQEPGLLHPYQGSSKIITELTDSWWSLSEKLIGVKFSNGLITTGEEPGYACRAGLSKLVAEGGGARPGRLTRAGRGDSVEAFLIQICCCFCS